MWPPLNKLSCMLPSTRLFLDPNVVYDDRRARQRAKWLFDDVSTDIKLASELDNFWPAELRTTQQKVPPGTTWA